VALRQGEILTSRGRELPFSFFPVGRGARRFGIFDLHFASRPWPVMRQAVRSTLDGVACDEALAFLEQSEDFYETARGRTAAHPLLHYYAVLNLGKALLRMRGFGASLESAHHGLQDTSAGTADPAQATLKVKGPSSSNPRVFREVLSHLGYPAPQAGAVYTAADLMAQVVVGHRLWREATGEKERFLVVEEIEMVHHAPTKRIWLRLYVDWPTMQRHGMRRKDLVARSGLSPTFSLHKDPTNPDRLCLEQSTPVTYNHRPTENVMDLVTPVRPVLWRIVSAVPGSSYRRYYLYLAPPGTARLTQFEAVWAILFYLGSAVRYRPHRFDEITDGPYGPFVDEFISAQLEQLLYLFASEMSRREVARPAIV
jgi:YaaC-like Protein